VGEKFSRKDCCQAWCPEYKQWTDGSGTEGLLSAVPCLAPSNYGQLLTVDMKLYNMLQSWLD